MKHFAGLDVGLEETAICIVDVENTIRGPLKGHGLKVGRGIDRPRLGHAAPDHAGADDASRPSTLPGQTTALALPSAPSSRVTGAQKKRKRSSS